MQENSLVHRDTVVKEWFRQANVEVSNWAAYFLDLNLIENICGALARMVYRIGRQYNTAEELKNGFLMNWQLLIHEKILHHIESMPRCHRAFIKADGGEFFVW